MAEVSRRAGVGMATLYRNFPSRRDLLQALYVAEVDAVCEQARTARGATPGSALRAWLRQAFAFASSKKHIAAELLTQWGTDREVFDDNRARVLAAARPLFAAAQQSQEVRSDLTLEQTLDMLVSIATIGGGARYRQPILETVLDGLAPAPTRREIPPVAPARL